MGHWIDSEERDRSLLPWLQHYNFTRQHGSLNYAPPIRRVFPQVQRLDKPQAPTSVGDSPGRPPAKSEFQGEVPQTVLVWQPNPLQQVPKARVRTEIIGSHVRLQYPGHIQRFLTVGLLDKIHSLILLAKSRIDGCG
jgi:hypothetical protein